MKVKINEVIEHGDQNFVIIDISHRVTIDGAMLVVTAYDPTMAQKVEEKALDLEQIGDQVIRIIKKATEGGGFNIGG